MSHTGHFEELMLDAKLAQVIRIGAIQRSRVVAQADRDAHTHFAAQGISLLFGNGDGMLRPVVIEVTA